MSFPLKIVGFLKSKGGAIPRNGLIGEWLFSGNANDTSGGGNDGTPSGASLTTDRDGNANSVYLFNGTSDYIGLIGATISSTIDVFTLSAWIYLDNVIGSKSILSHSNTANSNYFINIGTSADGFIFNWRNGTAAANRIYSNSGIFSSLTWYNVVMTKTYGYGVIPKLYVNKVNNTLYNNSTGAPASPTLLNTYNFGAVRRITDGTFFSGKLDNIRLYNRVLTASEIEALYNE